MSKKITEVESKEVTVAASTEVVAPINASDWGDVEVSASDLVAPKILLMQGTSVLVSEGKAMVGQIINQLTGEKMADYDSKIRVLPFLCRKEYVVSKKVGDTWKFDHTDEIKGEFARPYEEEKFGDTFKNEAQYSFYVLLEEGGIPAVVSFKGKSKKAGQQLFTKMYIQNPTQSPPLSPAHNWVTLTSKKEKNDKGPYAVWMVGMDSVSTKEEVATCLDWIRAVRSSKVKVQEDTVSEGNKVYADDNSAQF